jgi:hypothetical protein
MVQVVTASNGALPAITSAVSETRQPGVDSFTPHWTVRVLLTKEML